MISPKARTSGKVSVYFCLHVIAEIWDALLPIAPIVFFSCFSRGYTKRRNYSSDSEYENLSLTQMSTNR